MSTLLSPGPPLRPQTLSVFQGFDYETRGDLQVKRDDGTLYGIQTVTATEWDGPPLSCPPRMGG